MGFEPISPHEREQLANQALEHVNSSVKRCRIIKDQMRLWKD
jgi:hypothetical protein